MSTRTLRVLGITPFHRPDPSLAMALCRAGARAAIDPGPDPEAGMDAVREVARNVDGGVGVRLHDVESVDPDDLPAGVEFVILPAGTDPAPWSARTVIQRVTSVAEARAAVEAGADALIVAGSESPGRVGEETAFVLFQRCVEVVDVPLWVQGGIGPHTAAACLAGGAEGVVLEDQLGLAREATTGAEIRRALASTDGTQTEVIAGHRVFFRPDLEPVKAARGEAPERVAARLGSELASCLVPFGQGAAFAASLAERHETVGGIIDAIRSAAEAGVREARNGKLLGPDAPLARSLGTRVPILQGPMTRVSDRAGFAMAVAEAGGLPFLALALLGGEPLESLLSETSARLGDRPWGVGILGFVPEDKRAEQLEAIRSAAPRFALIAGGRPAQARRLEAEGIATFLHVPSSGLLDLFLAEGMRRFVFEGRECGGHVGPLSSFALWQNQIDRLLAFERPEEIEVVFAGGIHDARSAAMVAAMAAPLAARGARIGVLMGTAYLFTREAVESGAIVESYQRAAIECDQTVLLETAPGHATRCVDSAYVRTFLQERERLETEGRDPRETWERLEQLNLGRLRIASKGIRREGAELVDVDEEGRRTEGMYMLGQLAAQKREVVSVEDLHREISEGSVGWLESIAPRRIEPRSEEAGDTDVAIVGMACAFPGAEDLEGYWALVLDGVDAITEVPPERWRAEAFYDPDGVPGRTTPSKWGGFLDPIVFDPAAYGIPPNSIRSIDPIQLISLAIADRAIRDAGYGEREFDRRRTGVVFGADGGSDAPAVQGFRALYRQFVGELPEELDRRLPEPTEDTFPGMLANVISGRVANRLDLGGENCTVNAACASSLAAVAMAVRWLKAGVCDTVVVGGADLHNAAGDYLMFSSVHALSPGGRCRTFDHRADGITLGEGVGAIVLRRRRDAERDGDRIYAIIEGVGSSSDGRSMGLTAPRREGQSLALERAYRDADVDPAGIGLVEAHGTGTVVGDRTELESLTQLFLASGARPGTCTLGSVKSQIGHTKNAAGIASMIKAAKALQTGVLPPTIHIERPNDRYDPERSPFTFTDRPRPWIETSRQAGVSAFGFGGTNYHVVLASHGESRPERGRRAWPAELFLFHGEDRTAAMVEVKRLREFVGGDRPATMRDLAFTTATSGSGPVQIALVAEDVDDLREKLEAVVDDRTDEGIFRRSPDALDRPRLAYLFPGQGSQYTGMLRDSFVAFPRLVEVLRLAGDDVVGRMFPPQAFDGDDRAAREAALTETHVAQVALGVGEMAIARLLDDLGLRPDALAGHSFGETVALSVAGAWDEETEVRLSEARARAILDSVGDDPGTMAAVAAGPEEIESEIAEIEGVVLANRNAPRQSILSGPEGAVDEATRRLSEAGFATTTIRTACAFHSPVVAGARDAFHATLEGVDLRAPRRPVWANATARPYPDDPEAIREILADQIVSPVRFVEQIEDMYASGIRIFLEVGPSRTLTGLVGKILGERPHVAVPTDVRGESSLVRLLLALARLSVEGIEFDAARLFEGRASGPVDLESRDSAPTAWYVDGTGAWPVSAPRPEPVEPIGTPAAPVPHHSGAERSGPEAVVLEYLRNLQDLAEHQRRVVLEYLGADPAERPRRREREIEAGAETPTSIEQPVEPDPPYVDDRDTGQESVSLDSLEEMLLEIVSERTGYPADMLEPDLDLEADLSIDSIKRLEILGTLSDRLGMAERFGDEEDAVLEELGAVKTLRGIAEWIRRRAEEGAAAEEVERRDLADAMASAGIRSSPNGSSATIERLVPVIRETEPPTPNGASLGSTTFVVTDDGDGAAAALVALLQEQGAEARVVSGPESLPERFDGLVDLAGLTGAGGHDDVKRLFELARRAVRAEARWFVGVTGTGGTFGLDAGSRNGMESAGTGGLVKSLAREWPSKRVRVIDLDPGRTTDETARIVLQEILADDERVEVGYRNGSRRVVELVRSERPNGDAPRLELGSEDVILITGGARGITARISIELARRFGCTLELVGRTPLPAEGEDDELAEAIDSMALKKRLMERHPDWALKTIERRVRAIEAEREIRTTLEAIESAGGRARYHSVDVRTAAFGDLLDEIVERRGRLDGVIHAAGHIEDKLVADKERASFDRVFDTKVVGARILARKLAEDTRFVAFFSSVAGTFGNAGQADYAAANDALDGLASRLRERGFPRVVSVAWGPWATESGMVSPELRRRFEERGIALIPGSDGVDAFVDELRYGDETRVVLLARPRAS